MPYPPDHKQETRQRILASARRCFNRNGLSEVSIDTVMSGAGLTRGGFYSYFASKEELYAEAITLFADGITSELWQRPVADAQPASLSRAIVDAYLSRAHFEDVEGCCPMIGLPTDVARGGPAVKAAFRTVLDMMVGAFSAEFAADNYDASGARERALGMAALCVGGMVLARAVDEPSLADELRDAARRAAATIAGWEQSH